MACTITSGTSSRLAARRSLAGSSAPASRSPGAASSRDISRLITVLQNVVRVKQALLGMPARGSALAAGTQWLTYAAATLLRLGRSLPGHRLPKLTDLTFTLEDLRSTLYCDLVTHGRSMLPRALLVAGNR